MGDMLADIGKELAKQAPGVIGVVITVAMALNFMGTQAKDTAEAVRIQAKETAEAVRSIALATQESVRIQTQTVNSVLERNTEAFLKVHEHFESITRLFEKR